MLDCWKPKDCVLLEEGEVILTSSEDIRCFFYLFAIPEDWKAFMGFNRLVPPDLVPEKFRHEPCVLVARVLPMGFVNSVGIAFTEILLETSAPLILTFCNLSVNFDAIDLELAAKLCTEFTLTILTYLKLRTL